MNADNLGDGHAVKSGLLKPFHHVIARAVAIIAQIMVKGNLLDQPSFQPLDSFFRPKAMDESFRGWSKIIEPDFHG